MPENDELGMDEPEELGATFIPAPEPLPSQGSNWSWIGSPDRPEAQEHSDGISDLFTVSDDDIEASDEDLSDLTDVDIERDVLDADEDGSLDDLVTVTEADIMGFDDYGQRPAKTPSQQNRGRPSSRYRRGPSRYTPPPTLGGMSG